MGWIRCVHCEKLWCDFVARTSSLIASVQPVLHRVSCSNETNPKCTQIIRNEPILEFRVQWGGSGVLLRKIPMRLNGTNLSNNCTKFRVVTKHCQMHRNTTKCSRSWVLVPMGRIEFILSEKFRYDFMAQTCALIAPVEPILHRVSCRVQWGGLRAFVAKNSDGISWHELLH